jgi:hypothetical protein
MRMATVHQFESQLGGVIARRLALDNPELASRSAELLEHSRLITAFSMAAVRHAWSIWATSDPTPSLDDQVAESFAGMRTIAATGRP